MVIGVDVTVVVAVEETVVVVVGLVVSVEVGVDVAVVVGVVPSHPWKPPWLNASTISFSVVAVALQLVGS